MRQCTHKRAGIVTNQPDGYDSRRAHAALSVCGREACVAAAVSWVAGQTNERAVYVADKDRVPPSSAHAETR